MVPTDVWNFWQLFWQIFWPKFQRIHFWEIQNRYSPDTTYAWSCFVKPDLSGFQTNRSKWKILCDPKFGHQGSPNFGQKWNIKKSYLCQLSSSEYIKQLAGGRYIYAKNNSWLIVFRFAKTSSHAQVTAAFTGMNFWSFETYTIYKGVPRNVLCSGNIKKSHLCQIRCFLEFKNRGAKRLCF